MKSTLLSVIFVTLMIGETGCASNSGNSTETSGASDSGGTRGAGGSQSSSDSGGDESTGAQQSGETQSGGSGKNASASDAGGTSSAGGSKSSRGAGGTSSGEGSQSSGGPGGTSSVGGSQSSGGTGGKGTGGAVSSSRTQPSGGAQNGTAIRTRQIKTRGFTFDALEAGPDDGEPVLLLHGFPEISLEWSGLMPVLAAAGYHCLAPDQRGYSPGARPTEVDAYKYEELVADGFAFGSELGEKFHVVAHDWGANIAWLMLQKDPSRIASFATLAVPHYQVWARAVYEDPEMKQYLSMLTTWTTPEKGEAFWTESAMRSMWKAKPADQVDQTIAHMLEPGCMTAALNWYRASNAQKSVIEDYEAWEVSVPTLLIFGSTDIGQNTVTNTKPLMKGPFRVVQPKGGHFIVDEQPKVVADETLAHLKAYPIK